MRLAPLAAGKQERLHFLRLSAVGRQYWRTVPASTRKDGPVYLGEENMDIPLLPSLHIAFFFFFFAFAFGPFLKSNKKEIFFGDEVGFFFYLFILSSKYFCRCVQQKDEGYNISPTKSIVYILSRYMAVALPAIIFLCVTDLYFGVHFTLDSYIALTDHYSCGRREI